MIALTNQHTSTSLDQRLTMKVTICTVAHALLATTQRHLKRCKKLSTDQPFPCDVQTLHYWSVDPNIKWRMDLHTLVMVHKRHNNCEKNFDVICTSSLNQTSKKVLLVTKEWNSYVGSCKTLQHHFCLWVGFILLPFPFLPYVRI